MDIGSIEVVAIGGSKIADDGVWGEKGSFWSFEEGESIKDGDAGEVWVGVVLNLFNFDFESVDDWLDLSEPAVGDTIVAVVEFHLVEINIKERYGSCVHQESTMSIITFEVLQKLAFC